MTDRPRDLSAAEREAMEVCGRCGLTRECRVHRQLPPGPHLVPGLDEDRDTGLLPHPFQPTGETLPELLAERDAQIEHWRSRALAARPVQVDRPDEGSRQVGVGEDPPKPYELRAARYEIRRATEELDRAGVEKYDDRERSDSTDDSAGQEWSIQYRIKLLARRSAARLPERLRKVLVNYRAFGLPCAELGPGLHDFVAVDDIPAALAAAARGAVAGQGEADRSEWTTPESADLDTITQSKQEARRAAARLPVEDGLREGCVEQREGRDCTVHGMAPDSRICVTLSALPFVAWDRLVPFDEGMTVYGWIGRADARSDFVLITFDVRGEWSACWTSSAERSAEIHGLLTGGEAGHVECVRVADRFPALAAGLPLDVRSTVDPDGES